MVVEIERCCDITEGTDLVLFLGIHWGFKVADIHYTIALSGRIYLIFVLQFKLANCCLSCSPCCFEIIVKYI